MPEKKLAQDHRILASLVQDGFAVADKETVLLHGSVIGGPTQIVRWYQPKADPQEDEEMIRTFLTHVGSWHTAALEHRREEVWPRPRPGPQYIPVNLEARLRKVDETVSELRQAVAELRNAIAELREALRARPLVLSTEIVDLSSERYSLRHSIPIVIEEAEEETVASFPETETYGSGATPSQAMGELKKQIILLYDDLATSDPRELGKLPAAWWRILQYYISEQ